MTVVNTYRPILLMFKRFFRIGKVTPHDSKAQRRATYRWRVTGDNAVGVLEVLVPYLIEKRVQAELALLARETAPNMRGPLVQALKELKRVES